ncbi:MAG: c-type cytochrome [Alphaproteobacteria bacterium]|nr:c-type cytochrome [Alphaproteobacteria bacterium]MBV9152766.1 c-type cytochrome [Alphaproteobacteria bacterium]
MRPLRRSATAAAFGAAAFAVFAGGATHAIAQSDQRVGASATAQQEGAGPPIHSLGEQPGLQQKVEQYSGGTGALMKAPVSNLFPGGVSTRPNLQNPVGNDPAAPQRGMAYFTAFNCVGCHADNGGGGMGRALSNGFFQYGGEPANIYLSIVQGRPDGMPAWGGILPDAVIWDLVAYIEQISKAPDPQWGTTISAQSPNIEQVPSEFALTPNPWAYTEPFRNGQKPSGGKGQ